MTASLRTASSALVAVVAVVTLGLAAVRARGAAAEPGAPVLAAVAAAPDAPRDAWLVGPSGERYTPDGHGAWLRTTGGGVGDAVLVAQRDGAGVIVGVDGGPPFRFADGAWASIYLAQHAKAVVARGTRAVASVGRQVFELAHAGPQRLPDAPGPVLAIGASAAGIAVATAHGVARLEGHAWHTLARAPAGVTMLASERWAITPDSAFDLATSARTAWPSGAEVTAVAAEGDTLVAAAASASGVTLFTVRGGALASEAVPLAPAGVPVGVALAGSGSAASARARPALIALRDGRVLVREGEAWVTATVRDALPAPRPGAAAAFSH